MVLMCFSHKNIAKTFTQNVHLIDVERHGHFDKKSHKVLKCISNWKAAKNLSFSYKYILKRYTWLQQIGNGLPTTMV